MGYAFFCPINPRDLSFKVRNFFTCSLTIFNSIQNKSSPKLTVGKNIVQYHLMPNLCETCPIATKIDICCSSNPETGTAKEARLVKDGYSTFVCNSLQSDGSCGIYDERPEDCSSFVCEEIYALGLGAQRE